MKFDYTRISTSDQSSDLQTDQLVAEGYNEILSEVASGAKTNRPVLKDLLNKDRKGDVNEIADNLSISKVMLYQYLRYQSVGNVLAGEH